MKEIHFEVHSVLACTSRLLEALLIITIIKFHNLLNNYLLVLPTVNIVLVSDHGMAPTTPNVTTRYELDEYINLKLVENIADKGAFLVIKVKDNNTQEVRCSEN